MVVHYTDPYLLNPQHKITVNLVGLGGTGSQVLSSLARLSETLVALGHPGLHVRSWDNDIVTAANIGRQLFSPADVGQYKAIVLVTRLNRFFGYNWEAYTQKFTETKHHANITITCIDTAAGRIEIGEKLKGKPSNGEPHHRCIYWLDLGNLKKTGQAVLGTLQEVKQPKSGNKTIAVLPTVTQKFPQLKNIKEVDQGPSCSIAQSLNRQDLFINSTLANFGVNLLWKLFREGMITYHGCYVNLEHCLVTPMRIESKKVSKPNYKKSKH